jgi:hypothetical protein
MAIKEGQFGEKYGKKVAIEAIHIPTTEVKKKEFEVQKGRK